MMSDPLMIDPEVTGAYRFMAAAGAVGVSILTLNYAIRIDPRYCGHRLALVGWAIEALGVAIHQGYYWVWWLLRDVRPDGLAAWQSYRDVTSLALLLIAIGWVLVAAPYLMRLFGTRFWWIGGGGIVGALWIAGWSFARWL